MKNSAWIRMGTGGCLNTRNEDMSSESTRQVLRCSCQEPASSQSKRCDWGADREVDKDACARTPHVCVCVCSCVSMRLCHSMFIPHAQSDKANYINTCLNSHSVPNLQRHLPHRNHADFDNKTCFSPPLHTRYLFCIMLRLVCA